MLGVLVYFFTVCLFFVLSSPVKLFSSLRYILSCSDLHLVGPMPVISDSHLHIML